MILFDVGGTLFDDGKCNPSDSKINGNIIIHYKEDNNEIEESVYKYSDISGNAVYKFGAMDKLFVDAE